MRVLLLVAALHGLVPGLGELVESAVHYAAAGHLPHSPGETDRGDPGPEHACGVTLHACGCCAAQPLARELETAFLEPDAPALAGMRRDGRHAIDRAPARPFRPPIA